MIFLDTYSSYYLHVSSTTRPYFGMNSPKFGFPDGLGVSPPLSTTPVVDLAGAKSLLLVLLLYWEQS
jgi:hypothetical protein